MIFTRMYRREWRRIFGAYVPEQKLQAAIDDLQVTEWKAFMWFVRKWFLAKEPLDQDAMRQVKREIAKHL